MASIDKTYITSYDHYRQVIDWCKSKSITLYNGQTIYPSNFIYYPDVTKEEWDKWEMAYKSEYPEGKFDVVLWNTPTYFDYWLVRNCPFDFIQDRLKEQYGELFYEQIKAGTSDYDTYVRPEAGKRIKIKLIQGFPFRNNKLAWHIETPYWIWHKPNAGEILNYNEDTDQWQTEKELLPWTCNCCYKEGSLTKKNIVNMVRKWKLPKGTMLTFEAIYRGYLVTTYLVSVN